MKSSAKRTGCDNKTLLLYFSRETTTVLPKSIF